MSIKNEKTHSRIRIKLGATISFILGILAFLIAIFEAGIWCLLVIPLYILAILGSVLGLIPFIGPVLYYFGIGWLFNVILNSVGVSMPISSGIIFYSNLIFSIIYCFLISSLLVLWLIFQKRLKKLKIEEILNDKKNNQST